MRTLYKTSDVVRWLYLHNCEGTASTIRDQSEGAEFLDSSVLRKFLIDDLYEVIENEVEKHTYKAKTLW